MAATSDEMILGIDIGGNHVKLGFVERNGTIHEFQTYPTADWRNTIDFSQKLSDIIAFKLITHRGVNKVGIGLPGMINKDRTIPLEIPSIPELNNVPLYKILSEAMPSIEFQLENDANAAALGELLFGVEALDDTFAFVTLGTGIGSAAIIDGKIFTGGDGNGLELGHVLSRNNRRLEQNIGKQGILNLATERLAKWTKPTVIMSDQPISATRMVVAAENKDEFSLALFYEVGEILGESLVALIRILDIKTIVIGGGLSVSFDFIKPGVEFALHSYLTRYYLSGLSIRRASLGNDAGLLGAASLLF